MSMKTCRNLFNLNRKYFLCPVMSFHFIWTIQRREREREREGDRVFNKFIMNLSTPNSEKIAFSSFLGCELG